MLYPEEAEVRGSRICSCHPGTRASTSSPRAGTGSSAKDCAAPGAPARRRSPPRSSTRGSGRFASAAPRRPLRRCSGTASRACQRRRSLTFPFPGSSPGEATTQSTPYRPADARRRPCTRRSSRSRVPGTSRCSRARSSSRGRSNDSVRAGRDRDASMSLLAAALGPGAQQYLLQARQMQALSFAVHIPLVCFGIAFPAFVLYVEWRYLRTGDDLYLTLARRWSKALAALFAVGVITGTILSFEMGLLWPNFMATFGGVFGLGFAIEGFSFFLEAIFIGIYVYGWGRLSPRAHFASGFPIAVAGVTGSGSRLR